MSAFPESGRSDRQKSGEFRVRFRPIADIRASYSGLMAEVRQVEIILPSPVASQALVGDPHSCNPSFSAESEPRHCSPEN